MANETYLANQIRNDDWKAFSIVVSREYMDKDSYDMQTLLIGMHLLPRTKEDANRILENFLELDIPHAFYIRTIMDFYANPTLSNLSSFLQAKNKIQEFDDYYSRIILNCADFIYEDPAMFDLSSN